jgi:hypothetical protein
MIDTDDWLRISTELLSILPLLIGFKLIFTLMITAPMHHQKPVGDELERLQSGWDPGTNVLADNALS